MTRLWAQKGAKFGLVEDFGTVEQLFYAMCVSLHERFEIVFGPLISFKFMWAFGRDRGNYRGGFRLQTG